MQQKLTALAALLAGASAIPVAQYGAIDNIVSPPVSLDIASSSSDSNSYGASSSSSSGSSDGYSSLLSSSTPSASDSSVFAYSTPADLISSGSGGVAYPTGGNGGRHHHHHHRPHRPHYYYNPDGYPSPTPSDSQSLSSTAGGAYPGSSDSGSSLTSAYVSNDATSTTTIYATSTSIVSHITVTVDGPTPYSLSSDVSTSTDASATVDKYQDAPSSTPSATPSSSTSDAPTSAYAAAGAPATPAAYKQFNGDGSTGAGWPTMSDWVGDFEGFWQLQQAALGASCTNIFKQPDNSPEELSDLKDSVQSVAKDANLDPRFVLAVVMQESGGCVRAWNTSSPGDHINNPGLMQDHNGAHSCNTGAQDWSVGSGQFTAGTVSTPCPKDQIAGMIQDGVAGTAAGPGLKQLVAQAASQFSASDAQGYYVAARLYNSGSYPGSDLGAPGATRCYCSDVANRLVGWNDGTTKCSFA